MRKFLSILSILLIIAGIIFTLIPFVTNMMIKSYSTNAVVQETITKEEIIENTEKEATFDYSIVRDVEIKAVIEGAMEFDDDMIVGILTIPDLDVNLGVYKGITNANLMAGVATMKDGQYLGQGNYALAGHLMRDKSLLLGSLMDIEIGSKVILTDKEVVYEYEIYDTVITPDDAFYMIHDEEAEKRGRPIVSLMTCYHSSKTGKRFFALGELVNSYLYEK